MECPALPDMDKTFGPTLLFSSNGHRAYTAATHFYEAQEFCLNAGCRPQVASICCDYSDALKERDAEGDQAKAISLLDEFLAISSELEMLPLTKRVLARKL